jgi:RHS repeat-associated protein
VRNSQQQSGVPLNTNKQITTNNQQRSGIKMVNRIVSRLRVSACLLGLFSFVFATAQTPPPPAPDDDSFPFAILIKALTPVCSAFTATPASALVGGPVALAATCTNSPTTYEWYRGTTLLATTAAASYSTIAPATAATYEYAVVAKRGSILSLRKSANVSVVAAPPLSVSAVTNTTVNTPVTIQGTFNAPANSASIRVSTGNSFGINLPNVSGSFSTTWTPNQSGVYQLNVQAISNSNSQVLASQFIDIAVADLPAATALAIPATSSAGATAGSFGVSDIGGAQYSIPISIPPGIAGMQPGVSLNYSNMGGNGHVGVGWSIGGLSAISRCPKTVAQDGAKSGINYDTDVENDSFCLDGQRLVPVGTPSLVIGQAATGQSIGEVKVREYRTEIDRFDRVLSYEPTTNSLPNYKNTVAGPSNFKVFTKSGQIMEYGLRWWSKNDGASQALSDPNRGNTVRVWPLDKVADRNGNYYVVDYAGNANVIFSGPAIAAAPAPNAISPVGSFPQTEFYPAQITYTFNKGKGISSVNRVLFEYGDRPANDRHVMFDSGAGQHILTKRLERISTYIDGAIIDFDNVPLPDPITDTNVYPICSGTQCGTKVKEYRLAYDVAPSTSRSRLVSLEECSADAVCLPKTTFSWTRGDTDFNGSESGTYANDGDAFPEFQVADVDGDGRSDLVRRYGDNSITRALLSRSYGWEDRSITTNSGMSPRDPWGFADLNGDGKADFWNIANSTDGRGAPSPADAYFRFCITNPAATAMNCTGYNGSPGSPNAFVGGMSNGSYWQGDFNGDGKIDFLLFRGLDTNNGNAFDLYFGTANGINPTPRRIYFKALLGDRDLEKYIAVGDFNGDGRADLIMKTAPVSCLIGSEFGVSICDEYKLSWYVFFSKGELESTTVFDIPATIPDIGVIGTAGKLNKSVTLDFNGDGLADLMSPDSIADDPKFGVINLCLSAGDGSFGSSLTAVGARKVYTPGSLCKTITLPSPFDARVQTGILFGDFNGDGRTDMATDMNANGQYMVCISAIDLGIPDKNNIKFDCSVWLDTTVANAGIRAGADKLRIGDFNGDGKTDFAFGSAGFVKKTTAGGAFPDQITRITNGLGAYTEIFYAPITDNSVYTKGSGQTGNRIDIQSPMYVVKKTQSSNGVSGTFDTTYKYESLIGQTDGRGLMGFKKKIIEQYNGSATVRTETTYEQQDWWKAGRIKQVQKFVDNELLNQADNTYEAKTVAAPGGKTLYQVHMTSGTERSWNKNTVGGALVALPYTVTQAPLASTDGYGNIGSVTVATFEPNASASSYSKTTTSEYLAENAVAWILGRVTKATVTHTAPGKDAITRNSSFTYNTNTGQLTSETVEPSGIEDEKVTTTYGYDDFGNRTSSTVSWTENGAAKSRSSTTKFNANGRFVDWIRNAKAQQETHTYDARFGSLLTSKDPNNLKVAHTYDAFGRKVAEQLYDGANNLLGMSTSTYVAGTGGYNIETRTHTGGFASTYYDSLSRATASVTRTFDGTNASSATLYDAYGRKVWSSGPRGGSYNNVGVPVNGYLTSTHEYDKLGRMVTEVVRAGQNAPLGTAQTSTTYSYDALSDNGYVYSVATVSQSGAQHAGLASTHTVKKYTDSQGRTYKIIDNASQATTYSYNATGELEQVTGPGTISETMTYDRRGRKKTAINANLGSAYSYVYNAVGELKKQTDPKGQITTMEYDDLGRMFSRDEGSGFVSSWNFDTAANGVGKLASTTLRGTTHTYTYDAQSRNIATETVIEGFAPAYNRYSLYNRQGQLAYIGYPRASLTSDRFSVRYSYNANGFADKVIDGNNPSLVHWQAIARYHDGSLADGINGGAPVKKSHDILGRTSASILFQANGGIAVTSNYSYDAIGNVLTRAQTVSAGIITTAGSAANVSDTFCYDTLNRVTSAAGCGTAQFSYSGDGNLISKGGTTGSVGTITYGSTTRPNGAGPHAVSIANGKTYVYDANGNFTNYSDNTRVVTYTPFNLPATLTGSNPNLTGINGSTRLDYVYDSSHARVKELWVNADSRGSTVYIGQSFMEVAFQPDGTADYRHYIPTPEGIGGIYTVNTSAGNSSTRTVTGSKLRYWYKDHLGSPVAEYGSGATNLTVMSFDTWGLRRKSTSNAQVSTSDLASYASPRGYTGHEHLDEAGLIHMNGRIYDPMIGRFLQPDPIISEPYNSQNFNRYAYVLNNPLMYTDPSGYSTWTEIRRPVAAIIVAVITYNAAMFLATEGTVGVLSLQSLGQAQFYSSIASGFASGGVAGGNIESAIAGAFSAGLFFGVGELGLGSGSIGNIAAHAAAGCVSAGVQGGSCRAGALSAGFAEFAGPRLLTGKMVVDTVVHATLGGIGSMAGGGKFGNGAVTGAFGYLFNSFAHEIGDANAPSICYSCSQISEPPPAALVTVMSILMDASGYNASLEMIGAMAAGNVAGVATGAIGMATGKVRAAGTLINKFPNTVVDTDKVLESAIRYLGNGYKELKPGQFISADGTRRFRMKTNDITGKHGSGVPPHVHFEQVNPANPLGAALKNVHVKFKD